ncbi:PREDICTED: transcription factor GTE5, chloroplastic-like isoform X2 [Tarenaya hassleriana]|uniref:transcription factor GTE5, chloroplastic-like isoform X2 n=1 Tax=Tarenaya hassleriana TaxID=28532 RepID=UPI00053C7A40|nr:PREDICTED: transcription factor GTE5, chloroplastic-like isoform X2 [Tarenaya hassleriana]
MASGPLPGVGASKAKRKWSAGGNSKSQNRSKPSMAARKERPVPPVSPTNSIASEDDHHMVEISLNSISKLEVRNLKRKLKAELDEVRSLIKRLDPRGDVDGSFGGIPRADDSNKKMKTSNGGKKGGFGTDKGTVIQIFENCNNLLTKLMKHKFGWVFKVPVDAKGLGLHDYHTIVKRPMDLGTVKTRLSQNWYKSPLEFAEDVRLTFNNALLYNPKGHEVHHMAGHLLKMFQEKWVAMEMQCENLDTMNKQTRDVEFPIVDPLPAQTPSMSSPRIVENRALDRAESMTNPVEPETVTMVCEKPEEEASGERDLTFEEKRRLSEDLQDLPFDKLETVVQIIKKRNPELSQQDDEIELDIDSLDLKTLWELYRFVTEYKESSGKKKEDHGFGSERDAESIHDINQEQNKLATGSGTSRVTESGRATPTGENNVDGSSSCKSSSSDSGSCSSDSNSGSSSGHGSDMVRWV